MIFSGSTPEKTWVVQKEIKPASLPKCKKPWECILFLKPRPVPKDDTLLAIRRYVPLPPPPTTVVLNSGSSQGNRISDNGWAQVAICEEGGNNNPTYGYFGILPSSWGFYAGVSTAGQTDWNTQVTRANQLNGGHAPWAPPNCAAGGYKGW
jgi:hypothetical protein